MKKKEKEVSDLSLKLR